mmetsp:Transcript_4167/g.5367  ORF Transcript_4167/g.5367 Transcript_4167/m.5367 type:complete len:514 (+) Transcript_4167:74-1615(+)
MVAKSATVLPLTGNSPQKFNILDDSGQPNEDEDERKESEHQSLGNGIQRKSFDIEVRKMPIWGRRSEQSMTFHEFKPDKKERESIIRTLTRTLIEVVRDMGIGSLVGTWGFLVMTAVLWTRDLCYIEFWDYTNRSQRISTATIGIFRGLLIQLWPCGLFHFMLPHKFDRTFVLFNLFLISLDTLYRLVVYFLDIGAIEGVPLELPLNALFVFLVVINCYVMSRRLRPDKRAFLTLKFAIPLLAPIFFGAFFSHYILPIYEEYGDLGRQIIIVASIIILAISRGLCGMVMQTIAQLQAKKTFIIMSTIVALNSVLIRTLQAGLGTLSGKITNALILGVIEMCGTLFVPYGDFILYMLKHRTVKIPKGLAIPRRRRVFADVVLMSNKLECASVALANGIMFLVRTSYGRETTVGSLLKSFVGNTILLLLVESSYEFLTYLWLARIENIPVLRCGKAQSSLNIKLLLFIMTMGSLYFSSKVIPIVAASTSISDEDICTFCMPDDVCFAYSSYVSSP